MLEYCIISTGWLTSLVYSFTNLVITYFLWYIHVIHLGSHYLTIVVYSTYADVFIASLDYYHSMLTFSYHMIFYPILGMYTLIIAYF